MQVQRAVAPILVVALVVGLAVAVFVSVTHQNAARVAAGVVTVRGLIGSEKKTFLTDPAVLDLLKKNGVDLQVDTAGSRTMADRTDLANYDFAFPAGEPAAKRLMSVKKINKSYSPFYTPMTVASWKPIAEILIANGIVKKQGADYYIVDMKKLVDLIAAHKRWNELAHHEAYDVSKSVLISSTDVRQSNSAAMYLSLASYLLNGGDIVSSQAQVDKVMPTAAELFLRQGYQESSSSGPFDDYTTIGMGKAPLVMVYEAQFIEYMIENPNARNPNMVLLYPKPTVFTKHELIPLDEKGDKLGDLLTNNPDLQRLAGQHGLRTSDTGYRQFWKSHGVTAPDSLIDVVDPPTYEMLEAMIRYVEQKFQ
jgi:hypothetical protein